MIAIYGSVHQQEPFPSLFFLSITNIFKCTFEKKKFLKVFNLLQGSLHKLENAEKKIILEQGDRDDAQEITAF